MNGAAQWIKYLTFGFNLLFFISGCVLIGLGIWLNVDRNDWEGISDYNYISIANVVIVAGAIIVVVAFLGCCGAITENRMMLLVFFIFMLIIFLLEFGSGIAAYVWRSEIDDELRNQVNDRIPKRYYKETGVKEAMDAIQEHFKCCGVDSFTDWNEVVDGKSQVHRSCCIRDTDNSNYVASCDTRDYPDAWMKKTEYYHEGCYSSIKTSIEDNLLYIGICAIIFAVFQVIGMAFAMYLFCAIKKESQIV